MGEKYPGIKKYFHKHKKVKKYPDILKFHPKICHNLGLRNQIFMVSVTVRGVAMQADAVLAGPISQRVAMINRAMDIHRSSMANCVQLAINRNPF